MAFERWDKVGKTINNRVTIWKQGQINVSPGAVNLFGLEKYKAAALFYDPEHERIGLKFFATLDEPQTIHLTWRPKGGFGLGIKKFLDYYGIDYRHTRRYGLLRDSEADMFVIDLNDPEDDTPSAEKHHEAKDQNASVKDCESPCGTDEADRENSEPVTTDNKVSSLITAPVFTGF